MAYALNVPDRESSREIKRFFERALLPLPERGEFYWTKDGGRIVFLTPYGCVIRITPRARLFSNPSSHCLKPLFSRAAGNFVIDINPGVDCPASTEDAQKTKELLKRDGIDCGDLHEFNFGYLPGTGGSHVVMIDLDSQHVKQIGPAPQSAAEDPQDMIYAALRDAMKNAWDNGVIRPENVAQVWKSCAEMKAKGLLLSPWEESQNDYNGTTFAARHYAQKLALHKV